MALDARAARFGRLLQYAMDMGQAPCKPPLDPRAVAEGWTLCGHIEGVDWVPGEKDAGRLVNYGFVAEASAAPGTYVAVLRGTAGTLEWIEDVEFLLAPHPGGGLVEAGFWGVYNRLTYVPLGVGVSHPLNQGVARVLGPTGIVVVAGHSLGATLATYLTLDLALAFGERVEGCFLASPRPGDGVFAACFHNTVKSYTLWNYELDLVPRVPSGQGASSLPRAQWLSPDMAEARIKFDIWCNHHVNGYVAMLDYSQYDTGCANTLTCGIGPNRAVNFPQGATSK